MALTLRQAIDRTLTRLQIAQGLDVQVYAEEPIKEIINHKIDALFDLAWWPQFMTYGDAISIISGSPTTDISAKIKRFEDIRDLYLPSCPDPLSRIANMVNPSMITLPCFGPVNDATKVFKLFGRYTDTQVYVTYRTKPSHPTLDADVINFDDQLIILGTAYDYINGLGTGTNEEDKILKMFESRLNIVLGNIESQPVSQYDYVGGPPSGWEESY